MRKQRVNKVLGTAMVALCALSLCHCGVAPQPPKPTPSSAPSKQDKHISLGAQEAYQTLQLLLATNVQVLKRTAQKALANGEKELTKEKLSSHLQRLQQQLAETVSDDACFAIKQYNANAYQVVYKGCSFARDTLVLNGVVGVELSQNKASKQVQATVSFDNMQVNDGKVEGSLKCTVNAASVTEIQFETLDAFKTTTSTAKVSTLQAKGQVRLDEDADTIAYAGTGTILHNDKKKQLTFTGILLKRGDSLPSSGSIEIAYNIGKLDTTMEIIFSEKTAQTGEFDVKVHGQSLGSYATRELLP